MHCRMNDLTTYRKGQDMSQPQLARAWEINQATISRIESGDGPISLEMSLRVEFMSGGRVKAETIPMSDSARKVLRSLRRRMKGGGGW